MCVVVFAAQQSVQTVCDQEQHNGHSPYLASLVMLAMLSCDSPMAAFRPCTRWLCAPAGSAGVAACSICRASFWNSAGTGCP